MPEGQAGPRVDTLSIPGGLRAEACGAVLASQDPGGPASWGCRDGDLAFPRTAGGGPGAVDLDPSAAQHANWAWANHNPFYRMNGQPKYMDTKEGQREGPAVAWGCRLASRAFNQQASGRGFRA